MKRRNNKKLINTLKAVNNNGDISPLIKYFDGSYWKLSNYLIEIEEKGFFKRNPLKLTEKGNKLILKTNDKSNHNQGRQIS